MAKEMLKFGDVSAADIQLRLIASNGEEYGANPIHLHSQLVQKSNFLASMISERWSSAERPLKIEVTTTVPGFDNYVKCFGVMYSYVNGRRVCFSSVDECLAILQVAAHLLIDECINDSMEYLEAVSWTPDEESKIRGVISSLQLQTLPDLAARLDKLDCSSYLEMLEESTKEMLSHVFKRKMFWVLEFDEREIIWKYLKSKCDGRSSPEVADMCKRVFQKEFTAKIEFIKSSPSEPDRASACSILLWMLEMLERWDEIMYEATVKTFFEDAELAKKIGLISSVKLRKDALTIMVAFLKAIGNGKIITTRAYRLSFLKTWVPIVVDMMDTEFQDSIEGGVTKVIETLPLSHQKGIYEVWAHAYRRKNIDSTGLFKWWFEKLEQAFCKSKLGE